MSIETVKWPAFMSPAGIGAVDIGAVGGSLRPKAEPGFCKVCLTGKLCGSYAFGICSKCLIGIPVHRLLSGQLNDRSPIPRSAP